MSSPNHDTQRRKLLQGSGALMAASLFTTLQGLQMRQAHAATQFSNLVEGPYGPLAPVNDLSTGLPLLMLPAGFSYKSYGWTGDLMANGQPTPDRHDGMAVIQTRRVGRSTEMVLVRNHERGLGAFADRIQAPGTYDDGSINGSVALGGTTNLVFRNGNWISTMPSLAGTVVNCAGGLTPWGTWLSCEETNSNAMSSTGKKHGYIFEVTADPQQTTGLPIVGMGRFAHEAVAIDPATGIAYETEDARNVSTLYRYVPRFPNGGVGSLALGGQLQAARVVGQPNASLIVASLGDEVQLEWVDIAQPDADITTAGALNSVPPGASAGNGCSGTFGQAWNQGCLQMSRGEGIWYHEGKMYIADTSVGVDGSGRPGRGDGAVWELDLATMKMKAIYVSSGQLVGNNPDNITVSPRGGVMLCEDGGNSPDVYGPGSRMFGLTADGDAYYFAKNTTNLTAEQIAAAGKHIDAGNYQGSEFCGACWDPSGRVLFVNMQSPGITFAITGPWARGNQ